MYLLEDETYRKLIRLKEFIDYTGDKTVKARIDEIIKEIGYTSDNNFYVKLAKRKAKKRNKRGI